MIKSVRLKNFKSFQDVHVKLGPRNLLVGPNMSGKSNFIEVFRFLQRMILPQNGVSGLFNAFIGGFLEYTWKGGESNLVTITLEGDVAEAGDLQGAEWVYEIGIVGDVRGSIQVQEERFSLSIGGSDHELIVKRQTDRALVNRDGRVLMQNPDASRACLEFAPPGWDGAFLRKSVSSWRFYRLSPPRMKQANQSAAPPFLTEFGENLSSWLMLLQTKYADSFGRVRQACRDVFPHIIDLFTSPTQQSTVSVASKEQHLKRPISIWDMSDGELAFVALLSLIYCPLELGASLYFIEEPENHLHPKLMETLMELLKQEQEALGPSNSAQVLITTHSPQLVDKVLLDELIVFQKRDGATIVTYPGNKGHLRELLQSEELGLGDLFYSGALQGE